MWYDPSIGDSKAWTLSKNHLVMEAVTAAQGLSQSVNASRSCNMTWRFLVEPRVLVTFLTIVTNTSQRQCKREEGLFCAHGQEGGQAGETPLWSREFGPPLAAPPCQQVRRRECLGWERWQVITCKVFSQFVLSSHAPFLEIP